MGPYRLGRCVGRGGLGVVYHAVDERSGRVVAVKVLTQPAADTVAARRLAREFRALSEIEHRNIVRVLDAGVHEDYPFLVMEFVDGLSLRAYLDVSHRDDPDYAPHPPPAPRDESISVTGGWGDEAVGGSWLLDNDEPDSAPPHRRPLASGDGSAPPITVLAPAARVELNNPGRVLRLRDVMAQLCDGLAFIHARGLVHRDLKPSNILVEEGGCAKLVDFGLVKLRSSTGDTTAAGHLVGTYRYMAPEQARGEAVDGRSDLFALGGVLYEMLAGHPPFSQQQPAELLQAIVHHPSPTIEASNPEADPALSAIAMRLLSKDPDGRFQTAEEVARRLRAAGRRVP